jgi:hypothetical protein
VRRREKREEFSTLFDPNDDVQFARLDAFVGLAKPLREDLGKNSFATSLNTKVRETKGKETTTQRSRGSEAQQLFCFFSKEDRFI